MSLSTEFATAFLSLKYISNTGYNSICPDVGNSTHSQKAVASLSCGWKLRCDIQNTQQELKAGENLIIIIIIIIIVIIMIIM